ncbi:MAG TPA: PD-(D/E)XK nuclease family protein, partial [Solirubrobacteraceae bacterium]|nr:PD-(D/E)XK nuclease family protein [Solirubrobacteraceae bacterium]
MAGPRLAPAPPEEQAVAFLKRPEVRDVLAWLRLLVDPRDAAAVVRALARPPIELHQVELARAIQVARRRTPSGGVPRGRGPSLRQDPPCGRTGRQAGKLDLVLGLAAAAESPQVPPEARERIQRFLAVHADAVAVRDGAPPDVLLARLIELLHGPGRSLLAPYDLAEQDAGLERLRRLAVDYVRSRPLAGLGELVRHLAAARDDDAPPRDPGAEQPDGELRALLELAREEVLDGVARIGGRLGELRLDTDLDISHGVVRYLELLKLAALLQRPEGQDLAEALPDVNARLLAAATPLQREILLTSTLDETLLGGGDDAASPQGAGGERARASALPPREQRSLGPFLPRRGGGLALSASDIHTYRSCPLRYKYARVLRIPVAQTVHQRFGIVVHQVLERYHRAGGQTREQMLGLLEVCWRRAGFPPGGRGGEDGLDGELLEKARAALARYHERLGAEAAQPVWFERQFHFQLGPHHLRGRVDRVDRLPLPEGCADGAEVECEYELIDYKTSRPRGAEE